MHDHSILQAGQWTIQAAASIADTDDFTAEDGSLKETTNIGFTTAGLVTPPPALKESPKGPTTRSKSARKVSHHICECASDIVFARLNCCLVSSFKTAVAG